MQERPPFQPDARVQPDASGAALDPFARARFELQARLRATHPPGRPSGPPPTLERLVDEIAELRPLPAVAIRVLEITERERFSAHELALLVASDQALTATLLHLANSAYYGYARRIATVRDAVVLLGFRSVRSSVLAACVIDRHARTTHVDHAAFWQHSVAVALLAELLARTEGAQQDHAFTAGVMHNVGLLALDQHRPDLLGPALARAREQGLALSETLHATLGFTDNDLGAALAERWQFPAALTGAIRDHRRAPALGGGAGLAGSVARARLLLHAYGLGDGVEPRVAAEGVPEEWPEEWTVPPLSTSLAQAGGLAQVMERADAFLAAALG